MPYAEEGFDMRNEELAVKGDSSIEPVGLSAKPSARSRMARLLDRIIFLALLALIPLAAIPYGTVEPWWEALFECIVFVLGALWVVEGLLSGVWRISGLPLLMPLLAIIVFAFVQTLALWGASESINGAVWRALSADPYETRRFTFKLLTLTLAGVLLLRYTSGRRRLHALVYVVISVGVASAAFGIVREATQGSAPSFILPYLTPSRGYGQFLNKNHFAFLMEMALGLVLGLVVGGGVRRDHLLIYLAAALPLWTGLVLAKSRGGIFSMFTQLLFLILFSMAVRSRGGAEQSSSTPGWLQRIGGSLAFRAVLIVSLVIAVAISVVWMGGDPVVSRLEATSTEFSDEGIDMREGARRMEIWRATWELIKDNPFAGVGFGGYWVAIPKYHDASGNWTPQRAHNDYLELAASGGLIGITLGAWFVIALAKRSRECLQSLDSFRRAACLGAVAGIVGVAAHSFVDYGLHITVNALIFVALVVIATVDTPPLNLRPAYALSD